MIVRLGMRFETRSRTAVSDWRPLVCAVIMMAGCGVGGRGGGDARDSAAVAVDTTAASAAKAAVPYVAADSSVPLSGSVAVTVAVGDSVPDDTTVFPIRDFDTCGSQLTDNSIELEGRLLAGTITWLTNVARGKELPVRRRYEILHQRCLLWPRVQAVAVGGTVNIRNMDGAVHVLRFTDVGSGEVVARVTQSQRGQVVPNEYMLANPRVLEVTCESHPFTKAWIHVFGHPYFAVTDRSGNAVMDSVPPGSYQMVTWHERLGERRDSVTVTPGTRARSSIVLERK